MCKKCFEECVCCVVREGLNDLPSHYWLIRSTCKYLCFLSDFHSSCRTVMHLVVEGDREEIFKVLIEHDNLRLELQDKTGFPPLWHALASSTDFSDNSYASRLIKKGASPDAVSVLPSSCPHSDSLPSASN